MKSDKKGNVKIAVVDDHAFVLKGVAWFCDQEEDMKLTWTCGDVECASQRLVREPTDFIIVDLKLGDGLGFELLETIRDRELNTVPFVLSAHASRYLVSEAARLGARGFFSKIGETSKVLDAVREVRAGDRSTFFGEFRAWARPMATLNLSPRELDVLREIARGKTNEETAMSLGIRIGTVKTHTESLFGKLGVRSRTEAMREGLAQGYVHVDEFRESLASRWG